MLYGFDDFSSRRRTFFLIALAAALVWMIVQFRGSSNVFYSSMSAPGRPAQSASGNLAGSFGAIDGDSILGVPTISAAKIDQVLSSYNSPATGKGQVIYDMGIKYGIDPAYCLAFFIHESTAGTQGVARVTQSIGNIRTTAGYEDYQGYRKYPSWEAGIEDWYKLIRNLYIDEWQLTTIQDIIPVYAPPVENDTNHYVETVRTLVNSWRAAGS
ncbi:MAG TPA: hypothetical protein DEF47_07615 [Herpetosiphon sp.]|uniref:Mannosyl-glycoprotein endo-beta-N-acetylglucosamidase-like domain-containing protein n=1 Tax=Herpetosiphon aurantiacus (strain ATCC 23779 / DSM 785 / 114-95) TaxID=316274 RepID=A9B6B1_HERA2|nr:glucosaminidase domain-containing protein [Herpetosiphon sp.]ABX06322.1 hypothetical protein Haur_3686 [Herpetosiphon aurantiacus DSM 785]HBW49758.1 hypothetical protein [Herpetosiphon sp.]